MANMRATDKRYVMVTPTLEDIARLKRYAVEYAIYNNNGTLNVAGAIRDIVSRELNRRYPDLTAAEYKWCAAEQEKNEKARKSKKGSSNAH